MTVQAATAPAEAVTIQAEAVTAQADYDTAWKKILEDYFKDFLVLCYPKVANKIDWTRKCEFMDKELNSITNTSETGNLFVDKLVKVHRKNGQETHVLIHVEVQGEAEKDFAQRMFTYHYRLFDKYQKPVLSMAILTDKSRQWRPSFYKHSVWDCRLYFNFVSIKLLDFERRSQVLSNSNNPFAVVILAHLSSLKTKPEQEARYLAKQTLVGNLQKKGLNRAAIKNLLNFLDWVLTLSPELEKRFHETMKVSEEANNVSYITSFERIGIQKGLEQGREEGILTGERIFLFRLLQSKFGEISLEYQQRIEQANAAELLNWAENILKVTTLENVFGPIKESAE